MRETSPCDNSDDSGLGIENSPDYLYNSAIPHPSVFRFASAQVNMLGFYLLDEPTCTDIGSPNSCLI